MMMKKQCIPNSCYLILLLVTACHVVIPSESFVSRYHQQQHHSFCQTTSRLSFKVVSSSVISSSVKSSSFSRISRLRAEQQPNTEEKITLKDNNNDLIETTTNTIEPEEDSRYPINLPSPILLGSSMILAIASTGSLFQLVGGGLVNEYDFALAGSIAVVGLPIGLFLFIAAIKKAQAETEDDDKEFLSKKKNPFS